MTNYDSCEKMKQKVHRRLPQLYILRAQKKKHKEKQPPLYQSFGDKLISSGHLMRLYLSMHSNTVNVFTKLILVIKLNENFIYS